MKSIFLLFSFIGLLSLADAQKAGSPVSKTPAKEIQLKKVLTLAMPGEDGSNGASVAWHPLLKLYYAAMAGNAIYNLGVFDAKGKLVVDKKTKEAKAVPDPAWLLFEKCTLQLCSYHHRSRACEFIYRRHTAHAWNHRE